jgi:hypothetical protein
MQFKWWWIWRIFSVIWCCMIWRTVSNVSEYFSTSIVRIEDRRAYRKFVLLSVPSLFLSQWRKLTKERTTLARSFLKEVLHSTDLYSWTVLLTSTFGYSRQCGLDNCCCREHIFPFVLWNKNKLFPKNWLFMVLGAFAKFRKATLNFGVSVRPSSGLPLDGFSWNLILKYFSKIYREN